MALRKDGNSKNSSSYKPYDRSNSFVKKMTSTVTGLFSWRSNSQSESQGCNEVSYAATDDENVLPAAKRMRTQCEEETTLLKFIPNSNKTLQGGCSPIQPVNDLSVAGPSNSRNTCIASSTPANFHFSMLKNAPAVIQQDTNTEIPNTRVEHDKEESEIADTFTTSPLFNIHQRHNVTVPSISRDVPSHMSNADANKSLSGSFPSTNSRRPSFNVDAFSASNRRLSLSVCENRNRNCLSPFYKARTIYGGASALLPYGGQTLSRMRSASTSNLDVFSPRSQITMQPVPSPSISNDQETMSAAARRILDTLEKYCSPIADAKRIPLNEPSKMSEPQQTPRGLKRKLPSLNQMMPSTSDLLRIKRAEKMQDSISSAKQTAASVVESTIATEDSDSSSDSVELDYSALTNTTKKTGNDYLSKINRKNVSKFDDRPLTPVKLPKAELKISNLPKFDVTDMFTFSKPLLLENLDQNVEEPTTAAEEVASVSFDDQKSTPSTKKTPATNKKRAPRTNTKNVSKPSPKSVATKESPSVKKPDVSTPSKPFVPNNFVFSKSDTSNATISWTCKLCLANNTGERCSGCSCNRQSPTTKPIEPPKALVTEPPVSKPSAIPATPSWGDAFKPPSDTWECKECFVRNQNTCDKCAACGTSRNNVTATVDVPDGGSPKSLPSIIGSNDLWKNFQKAAADQWKCDSCWIQNKKEDTKCASCGEPKEKPTKTTTTAATSSFNTAPKTTLTFGVNKGGTASPTTISSETFKFGVEKPTINFMSGSTSAADTKSTFTFGVNPVVATTTATSIIAPAAGAADQTKISSSVPPFTFGFKKETTEAADTSKSCTITFANPLLNSSPFSGKKEGEKTTNERKETIIFNDVSSSTNTKSAAMNDTSALKAPKFGIPKSSGPMSKENGNEEVSSGRNIFNDISSSTESPSKRKASLFSSLFANKESNGLVKSEANSLANGGVAFVSSSSSTFGGIQSSSLLSSAGTSKLTNDSTSMFASTFKNDQNAEEKKLFSSSGSFTASSTQPSVNSFGSFTTSDTGLFGKKSESTIATSNVNAGFSGSSGSAFTFSANVTTPAAPAAPPSGGFPFNGPKTEDAGSNQPKFSFGASNSTTGFGSGGLQFSFGAQANPTPNDRTPLTNSVFSGGIVTKQPQDAQAMAPNNTVSGFSNNIFGTTSQTAAPPQTANPVKKSGGFNYAPPTYFGSSTINSFSGFPSAPVENQEQNRLNNTPAPAPSTFVFGASNNQMTQHNFNLTVPPTFNFTGGNAITSFSPVPSSTGTAPSAAAPRRIKKAVRRTTKN